jgi:hypothetical protein
MKLVRPSLKLGMTTLVVFASIGVAVHSRAKANAADETATAHAVSVKGYVRDAECPLRYKQSMKPQGSCAMDCVKKGSPIALITKKGELFIAVDPTPEKDVRPFSNAAFWEVRRGYRGHPGTRRHARYYRKDDQRRA